VTAAPKKRRDPPLRLDMDFAEALGRFIQTDPAELPEKAQAPPKTERNPRAAPEKPSSRGRRSRRAG
jgi:hypothetical protein